ncbi:hypothetical protein ACI6PS_06690 [Flavobacterium sp. PLA-1-15]|uniref:hypothetical protein n=1 Tax=Flavobacterium sp. PLA-1-15 TaxID=3380533 RepID=UPI003B79C0A9
MIYLITSDNKQFGSASPTTGKPLLLPHDVSPTAAFDAFRKGMKNSFRNDDKAERSL